MLNNRSQMYIGTILLERNRWQPRKQPSYPVSAWIERFRAAGFDGMELWENHALLCAADERAALAATTFPIAVFNSYAMFENGAAEQRRRAANMATRLHARTIKFNLGNDPALYPTYINHLRAWRASMPDNMHLLCECHPGTVLETPLMAARMLRDVASQDLQVIIHPFTTQLDTLRAWFDDVGDAITHAHVQLRDEQGAFLPLHRRPKVVKDALQVMQEWGFHGSFTIEFTEGVHTAGEDQAALFAAAVSDLHILKEYWG